jgi:ClpP class serine protease
MPSWGEILVELQDPATRLPNGSPDFDGVRKKYLSALRTLTGRPTILYYTDWLSGGGAASSITLEDMQGMMEVCKDLEGPSLDIILHSPGGSPEAAASIVRYMRTKFTDVRAFVPLAAMSAATMWALSCDRIVMGKHSQLGPIDPQMVSAQWTAPGEFKR